MGMSHRIVAMNTVQHVTARIHRQHRMNEISMTLNARPLSNSAISRLDLNGLMKLPGCKRPGMQHSVVGFRKPFPKERMRQMAVVAGRDCMMAGLLPGVIMGLHHMTVGASLGVIGKVGGSATIAESEHPQAAHGAKQTSRYQRKPLKAPWYQPFGADSVFFKAHRYASILAPRFPTIQCNTCRRPISGPFAHR